MLIQSAFPDNPLLTSLVTEGYEGFANRALAERQAAGWPPYSRLALLRADGPDRGEVFAFLREARDLAGGAGEVRILGPAAAAMERRAGLHPLLVVRGRAAVHEHHVQRARPAERLGRGR